MNRSKSFRRSSRIGRTVVKKTTSGRGTYRLCGSQRLRSGRLSPHQREQLILTHLPLIKFIAHRIASRLPRGVEICDLVNAGALGLLDAAAKYDSSHNVQFKTYAELRIGGAIIDSLRQMDWAPRSLRQKERMLERTRGKLTQQLGRAVEGREVAEAMGMKLGEYHKLVLDLNGITFGAFQSVNPADAASEDPVEVLEFIPAGENSNPHRICERTEVRSLLGKAIDALPKKERLVVSLYYYEELSMKEIGTVLRVNESRVSQLHTKAMLFLQRRLRNSHPMLGAAA